jgi:hypothetical protein
MLELQKLMKKQKYKPKSCSAQLRWLHNKLHESQFDNNSHAKFKGLYGIDNVALH